MFRARHSGVSNPSLGPSYRVIRNFKVTFVVYFSINGSFLQLNHTLTLVEEIFFFYTLYAVGLLTRVNRMTAVAGTRFTNPSINIA